MTQRAALKQEDLRRAARVARDEHVPICVELPDGTRYHFGPSGKAPPANALDEMFG